MFKDGVACDPGALIAAAEGAIGRFDPRSVVRWPFNVLLGGLVLLLAFRIAWRRRTT